MYNNFFYRLLYINIVNLPLIESKVLMNNLELANILINIAELNKENPGMEKALSLMSAARTIRDYPEDIEKVYIKNKLANLPGIDNLSFKYIEEYFKEGKISEYDELAKDYSEELLKFIRVSGLGRKKMEGIYKKLNIETLGGLKSRIYSKGIEKYLDSFTIKRLCETITYYQEMDNLFPRWFVENLMEPIISKIKKLAQIKKIKPVGSIRRRKAAVRDIDILALAEFNNEKLNLKLSKKLLDSFLKFEEIKGKIGQKIIGESISYKYRTKFGFELEIILTTRNNWALDLFYTTGSRKHIEKIKNLAKSKGFYKEEKIKFNKKITREKDVYKNLGLSFIPPELREGRDEINLAQKGKLPNLLKLEDIKGDLHVHSKWSDGLIEDSDYLEIIKKYGYEYLALTDHSKSNRPGNGLSERRLMDKFSYIQKMNKISDKAKIIMGSEVDVLKEGRLDYGDEILDKLDIVIASMHSSYKYDMEENNFRVAEAIKNRYVDFIAHPTSAVFNNRLPHFIDIDKLIYNAKKYNKALEINSYFMRLDLNDENARKAKNAGVTLVINTDSHRAYNLENIKLGVDIARRAGLEKKDVLNTLSWEEILKWKKNR